MIVKIQRPVFSSEPNRGFVLIYNEDRDIYLEMEPEDFISLFKENEFKIYHHAHMEGTLLHIDERAQDQDW